MLKSLIALKTRKPKKAAESRPSIRVEYPREGEVLLHHSYTFQIDALPDAQCAEVAIDNGAWQPCRESLGLWWYDWSSYPKGEHALVARARLGDGIYATSTPRHFSVG